MVKETVERIRDGERAAAEIIREAESRCAEARAGIGRKIIEFRQQQEAALELLRQQMEAAAAQEKAAALEQLSVETTARVADIRRLSATRRSPAARRIWETLIRPLLRP